MKVNSLVCRSVDSILLLVLALLMNTHVANAASVVAEYSGSESQWLSVEIVGQIESGDASKVQQLVSSMKKPNMWELNWLHVRLNSNGGDVNEALVIGRILREQNAWISLYADDQCLSSCVFVYMSGVQRIPFAVNSQIGIHRPFLSDASNTTDFGAQYTNLRTALESYFEEMRVSKTLLDAMYAVSPEEMRILTNEEIEQFIPLEDPVHDEAITTYWAKFYLTTNRQYRQRKVAAQKCTSSLIEGTINRNEYEDCREAAMWDLSIPEYLARKLLIERIYGSEGVDWSMLSIPSGLSRSDCRRHILNNGI